MSKPERLRAVAPLLALGLLVGLAACSANNAETESSKGSVVARIGDEAITLEQVDEQLQKTNPKAFQEMFDARQAVLDQMISERLLAAEAKSRGVTLMQLQQDIAAGVPAVSDAEVENFYNQQQSRMGGRSLDEMREQIRSFLVRNTQQQAMGNLLNDLRQKSNVKLLMEPPRMEVKVAANDPAKGGPEGAPITLVEFSDFQ